MRETQDVSPLHQQQYTKTSHTKTAKMSDWNRHFDRLHYYGVSNSAESSYSSTTANAAGAQWPPMPIGPDQRAQVLAIRSHHLTNLLNVAISREETARTTVEQERLLFRRLQEDYMMRRLGLQVRINSAQALMREGGLDLQRALCGAGGSVRQVYEDYRWQYGVLVAEHGQDMANLEFVIASHQQAVRDVASARRRLQEERVLVAASHW